MIKKQNSSSLYLSWTDLLTLSAWLYGGLLYFVGIAITLITGMAWLGTIVLSFYFVMLIALSYHQWAKNVRANDLLFVFILILVVLFSYALYSDSRIFIKRHAFQLFFQILPYYFVGLIMKKEERTFNLLYYGSVLAVLTNLLYIAIILGTGREMQEDNLFLSYSVLPHVLMILWRAMKEKKLFPIVAAVASVLLVISLGSRGPVLSCLAFLVFYALRSLKWHWTGKAFVLGLLGVLVYFFTTTDAWSAFLLWLREIIESFNISTRVIDSVLYEAAEGSDEARLIIYEKLLSHIKDRPLFGYGIYGDWPIIQYSAHQILLELWVHYGVLFGSALLLIGGALIIRAYKRSSNHFSQVFILLMIAFGVVRGIYAGSYLSDYIFLLIGFCVGARRQKSPSERSKSC